MGRVMAGVVFVFVREDASEAEALAEAFDAAGFTITGNAMDDDALSVVIWSRKAMRSPAFRDAAQRALRTGRCVVASLSATPSAEDVHGAPVIDLGAWTGEDDAGLDRLFESAATVVRPHTASVIVLPSRPTYEDAEFIELAPRLTGGEDERVKRARRSWEAPIPTEMLQPVREPPRVNVKEGAPSPRRDFRRLADKPNPSRAQAGLAIAAIALVGGSVLAISTHRPDASREVVSTAGVSVALASADAAGLDDIAPAEPPQIGRAGLEPPTARQRPRHTRYARGDDRAAYEPPVLIPDSIVANLQTSEGRGG